MKPLKSIMGHLLVLFIFSFVFSSCDKNEVPERTVFLFGLTSSSSTSSQEIDIIEGAYADAYRRAGLKFNSESFGLGASKDLIIKACNEADAAIERSLIKFAGCYVYEVRTPNEKIFRKVYGVRK